MIFIRPLDHHYMKIHPFAAVLMISFLSFCSSPKDDTTRNEMSIAYNVLFDAESDNYEVFTMDLQGSDKKNITNLAGVEWAYLAFKNRLFFISDKDTLARCFFLYETDYQGSKKRKVSDIRLADSWMSTRFDGQEMIVKPHRIVDSAFYIINTTSGNLLQRLETGLPFANDPLFINKGSQVIFRGGNKKSKRDEGFLDELYRINSDGTDLVQLTHYPKDDTTAKWYDYHAGPPRLHPTENFITYQSYQQGKYSLYVITNDGSRNWKLTDLPYNEGWHDWSADGNWLAIEIFDNDQTQFHIGLMNWKTRNFTFLTDSTHKYQQAPVFVLK